MPLSHYRRYVPRLEVLLSEGTAPRSPHFVQVIHTTGGRPLIGHSFLLLIIVGWQFYKCSVTFSNLNSPSEEHVAK